MSQRNFKMMYFFKDSGWDRCEKRAGEFESTCWYRYFSPASPGPSLCPHFKHRHPPLIVSHPWAFPPPFHWAKPFSDPVWQCSIWSAGVRYKWRSAFLSSQKRPRSPLMAAHTLDWGERRQGSRAGLAFLGRSVRWMGLGLLLRLAEGSRLRPRQSSSPSLPGCQQDACPAYSLSQPYCSAAVTSQGSQRHSRFWGHDEEKTDLFNISSLSLQQDKLCLREF